MSRLILLFLFALIVSCKSKKIQILTNQGNTLTINCENERSLIENPAVNLEYSFDSISSVKNYWKNVNNDQRISLNTKLYPYVSVDLDTPSLYQNVKIGLIGSQDWKQDGRLKQFFENINIDSIRITNFFNRVSERFDIKSQSDVVLLSTRHNAEIVLYFDNDSIQNISSSLKKIARIYISFQKANSQKLFHSQLCDLDIVHLDSLKRNVPLRIRLVSMKNGR